MIAEMVETRERIFREFFKGCDEIKKKYVGTILTKDALEGVRAETAKLAENITKEVGIRITPGEVTVTSSDSVTIGEPYVELHDGGRCKLSDWLNDL